MPYLSPNSSDSLSPLALRRDLRRAITSGGLDLAFQPIFSVDNLEKPESAEALLRWIHPTQGQIDPSTMISIAEQSGLIRELGEWIVTEAIRSAAALTKGDYGDSLTSVAVNVSALQVGRPEFVDMVAASLDFHQLDPSMLTLELTESHLIDRVDNARPAIAELSNLGVRLAVDDFGTGSSTFEYLLSLPVYAVKIDPSFTKRLTEPRGAAMLRGLSSACRELDMQVIVEGIETVEQLGAARRAGVTHVQGYLLGMPLSTANLGVRSDTAA
jgi:EAL domain-containing protein (putative c-di-GMP-specific phosphodiesterase class I)